MPKSRGYYVVQVIWPDGATFKVETRPGVSMTPEELVSALRRWADHIEGTLRVKDAVPMSTLVAVPPGVRKVTADGSGE